MERFSRSGEVPGAAAVGEQSVVADTVGARGQELKWLRPGEMKNLEMPPADVPLVAMLRDFL